MNKTYLFLMAISIFAFNIATALPPGALPQPEFEKKKFLLIPDIEDHTTDRECKLWIWGDADDWDWAYPGHRY